MMSNMWIAWKKQMNVAVVVNNDTKSVNQSWSSRIWIIVKAIVMLHLAKTHYVNDFIGYFEKKVSIYFSGFHLNRFTCQMTHDRFSVAQLDQILSRLLFLFRFHTMISVIINPFTFCIIYLKNEFCGYISHSSISL